MIIGSLALSFIVLSDYRLSIQCLLLYLFMHLSVIYSIENIHVTIFSTVYKRLILFNISVEDVIT